ncbi:MAG: translation initiation factor IF-3 [Puniceicoccales bacterium]|jgi:translation initiation factor IF-3|nr:translation initiation factor IF-3 [Puniceicoccales bacterium]
MAGNVPFRPRPSYGKRPQGRSDVVRKNDRIRAEKVRVIDPEGKQLGILPIGEALRLAKDCGLDLVEISAAAHPPVCKITDFGKHQYKEGKKQKNQKDTSAKLKEVKFRLNIEAHDYETKVRHGMGFLQDGDKLKVVLSLRAREMERKAFGMDIIRRVIESLADYGTTDGEPRMAGRDIIVLFSPKAHANKHKQSQKNAPNPDGSESIISPSP